VAHAILHVTMSWTMKTPFIWGQPGDLLSVSRFIREISYYITTVSLVTLLNFCNYCELLYMQIEKCSLVISLSALFLCCLWPALCMRPWECVPYLSALEVWSRQGAIQIHIYLYLTFVCDSIHFVSCTTMQYSSSRSFFWLTRVSDFIPQIHCSELHSIQLYNMLVFHVQSKAVR